MKYKSISAVLHWPFRYLNFLCLFSVLGHEQLQSLSQIAPLRHLCINGRSFNLRARLPEGFLLLKQLKTVDLSSTFLSDQHFERIITELPNLERIIVNKCEMLSNNLLSTLSNIENRSLIVEAKLTKIESKNQQLSKNVKIYL